MTIQFGTTHIKKRYYEVYIAEQSSAFSFAKNASYDDMITVIDASSSVIHVGICEAKPMVKTTSGDLFKSNIGVSIPLEKLTEVTFTLLGVVNEKYEFFLGLQDKMVSVLFLSKDGYSILSRDLRIDTNIASIGNSYESMPIKCSRKWSSMLIGRGNPAEIIPIDYIVSCNIWHPAGHTPNGDYVVSCDEWEIVANPALSIMPNPEQFGFYLVTATGTGIMKALVIYGDDVVTREMIESDGFVYTEPVSIYHDFTVYAISSETDQIATITAPGLGG